MIACLEARSISEFNRRREYVKTQRTVEEVVAWLRNNTDPQDSGAAQVARAIAIFQEAVQKIDAWESLDGKKL